jgi:hypothetical protein
MATLTFLHHRALCLFELPNSIAPKQHRTMIHQWQKLRSTVLAIPGGKGLVSVLQEARQAKCIQGTRVKLSSAVHLVLAYFRWLTEDLTQQPTHIAEIIPKEKPDTLGARDAAAMAMGGLHCVPQRYGLIQPILR